MLSESSPHICIPHYRLRSESDTGYGRRDGPEVQLPNQFPVSLWLESVPLLLHVQLDADDKTNSCRTFQKILCFFCLMVEEIGELDTWADRQHEHPSKNNADGRARTPTEKTTRVRRALTELLIGYKE